LGEGQFSFLYGSNGLGPATRMHLS